MSVGSVKGSPKLVTPKQILKTGGNITFQPGKYHSAKVGGDPPPAASTKNIKQDFFATLSKKFQKMPLA